MRKTAQKMTLEEFQTEFKEMFDKKQMFVDYEHGDIVGIVPDGSETIVGWMNDLDNTAKYLREYNSPDKW